MRKFAAFLLPLALLLSLTACGSAETKQQENMQAGDIEDGFILITGGTFQMGSPDTENWRSDDETQHTVTVSDFYMAPYEVTQAEYEAAVGIHPHADCVFPGRV